MTRCDFSVQKLVNYEVKLDILISRLGFFERMCMAFPFGLSSSSVSYTGVEFSKFSKSILFFSSFPLSLFLLS